MGLKIYTGRLEIFFETGTEGVVWAFQESGKKDHEGLVFIEQGDTLWIDSDGSQGCGSQVFAGTIDEDHKTGWAEYPKNPGHGQPTACSLWIHWTQRGWRPDDWAQLFLESRAARLRKAEERINRVSFTRKLNNLHNVILVLDKIQPDEYLGMPSERKKNIIPLDIVAARLDRKTVVFNQQLGFKVNDTEAILTYRSCMLADEVKNLVIDRGLIKSAHRDSELIYDCR